MTIIDMMSYMCVTPWSGFYDCPVSNHIYCLFELLWYKLLKKVIILYFIVSFIRQLSDKEIIGFCDIKIDVIVSAIASCTSVYVRLHFFFFSVIVKSK